MRRAFGDVVHGALLLTAVVLAAWLSLHWQARVDLSHGARSSLPPAARDALAALQGPLEIVSYAREGGNLRSTIAAFVQRYQVHRPDLALRFVDPDLDPSAMRARGITIDGELVLAYRGREEHLTELGDRELARAMLRLARPRERSVAFVGGHGERRPDGAANHDYGDFAAALAEQGVSARTLDLARDPVVPPGTDLLVLADPRVAPGERELAVLQAHLEAGGALLWLTEPGTPAPVEPLARALGLRVLPGTVVDAAGQALGIGDPSFVAVGAYPDHPATRGFDLTTLLPQAAALASLGSGFAAVPLMRSGERSWTESGAVADAIRYDAGGSEVPGPHDLALALTRLSPRPDRSTQRAIVAGDADFLANSFLGNGGNRALGLRLVNWLLADDALIDVAPVEAPDRELRLNAAHAGLLGLGFLVVLPIALLLTGFAIAWRRRRR